MSSGDHQAHSVTPGPSNQQPDGVPVVTWIIGGAAILIVLTAGALMLETDKDGTDHPSVAEETEEQAPTRDPAQDLAPANPLEITPWFLDAQERSKLWNPKAMLSRIEVIVADGKPSGPVQFEFGEAIGRAIPGAPLSPKRYTVSYRGKSVEENSIDSPKKRVALPEPNCPLEVAFGKLTHGGINTDGRVAVMYINSEKHGRPVWLVTNEHGQTTSVNANTCSLVLR